MVLIKQTIKLSLIYQQIIFGLSQIYGHISAYKPFSSETMEEEKVVFVQMKLNATTFNLVPQKKKCKTGSGWHTET